MGCCWCVSMSIFKARIAGRLIYSGGTWYVKNIPKQGVTDVCMMESEEVGVMVLGTARAREPNRQWESPNPAWTKKIIHSLLLRASFSLQKAIVLSFYVLRRRPPPPFLLLGFFNAFACNFCTSVVWFTGRWWDIELQPECRCVW